ncbi:MAG: hypothetical protein JWM68_2234 [Verrucomicrobiales bacterium]|nr:hypothetical protein [Verrucomicrobiales bacterium]
MLFNERAQFDLACRLRLKAVPLGEVFSFLSGLYFRGKLTYAQKFAQAPPTVPGTLVITSNRGVIDVTTPVTRKELELFSTTPIDEADERYRRPLLREARRIAKRVDASCEIVLLGSIATKKYVEVLLEVFGERLLFPSEFVGRGDMSRGGLLLRAASDNEELNYISVSGAVRHGTRPAKLTPRRYSTTG